MESLNKNIGIVEARWRYMLCVKASRFNDHSGRVRNLYIDSVLTAQMRYIPEI